MTPIFLDTVGLIALWDKSDQWHEMAMPVFLRLLATKRRLLTSSYVLLECANASSRRPYFTEVCDLRERMAAVQRVLEPSEGEIEQSWDNYRNSYIGGPGVVDFVSFALMQRFGIRQAFTNDKHFAAAGFEVLF